MIFRRVVELGYVENEGYIFLKQVAGNPEEELQIFVDGKRHYIGRAVHSITGRVIGYKRVSDYYETFVTAKLMLMYLIRKGKGKYDYCIRDYLYSDDTYVEGYSLTPEQQEKVIIDRSE